jgi:hypothetical protein
MSLRSVVQQLRALPYTEMKALAAKVRLGLGTQPPNETQVADVLSSLPNITDDELDIEQEILGDFFRRKRAITITSAAGSEGPWTISYAGGIMVSSDTVRGALSEFLDALAAYHALSRK